MSVDYYVRLEQGRSPNVSAAILDAIATALRLSDIEREHLDTLAHPSEADEPSLPLIQTLKPGIQRLLDQMAAVPAFVLGRRTDVLGWNALADAVMGFSSLDGRARNAAWFTFIDPRANELYADWEGIAAQTVAYLSLDAGRHPGDRRLAALVGELSIASTSFRRLWARHDILEHTNGPKLVRHPIAGELVFTYEILTMPDDPDQLLSTLTVEPGSPTAERLQMLASWNAGHVEQRPAIAAPMPLDAPAASDSAPSGPLNGPPPPPSSDVEAHQ